MLGVGAMIVLLLVFFLLFLLFMPIPLKLSIKYLDDFYEIKFYKINLLSSDGGIIKKFIKDDTVKKYDTSHNIKEEVEEKAQEKIRGTKFSMRLLFKNLSNNRYKPYFKVNSNIDFFGFMQCFSFESIFNFLLNNVSLNFPYF